MKLQFDIRGNLLPYEITELSTEDFQNSFILPFQDDSTRNELFKKYLFYLNDLKELITHNFFQWIDGSFISQKKNPKDIDLVTIVDYRDYEKNISTLSQKFISFNARKGYGIDAYIVCNYPENHPKRFFTQSDLLYWMNLFEKTKVNKAKQQFKKGFVQINFNINEK